jgi:hypothetical protein
MGDFAMPAKVRGRLERGMVKPLFKFQTDMPLPKSCAKAGYAMTNPDTMAVFHPLFGEIVFSSLTPEMCQWLIEHGFNGLLKVENSDEPATLA